MKSHHEYEIEKVDIMGKDRYIVGHTINTLLVGDMNNRKLSEVSRIGIGLMEWE